MLLHRSPTVALVSASRHIDFTAVTAVAAALQHQVIEDYQPVWGGTATVIAVQSVKQVPHYAWPVIVVDQNLGGGALGYHVDQNNRPYALVEATASWTLTASHELLEMLADPWGNRKQIAQSLNPSRFPGNLQYLIELCDPCEAPAFAYTKGGVPVSDFITPEFYDAVPQANASYSFRRNIKHPLQILDGGYISFLDPNTGRWFQGVMQGATLGFKELPSDSSAKSLRSYVNRHCPHQPPRLDRDAPLIRNAEQMRRQQHEANRSHAERFIEHLGEVHPGTKTADSLIDLNIGSVNIF